MLSVQACLDSASDQLDLDSVFVDQGKERIAVVSDRHTVGYMLLWLLITKCIGKCQLEVNGCILISFNGCIAGLYIYK